MKRRWAEIFFLVAISWAVNMAAAELQPPTFELRTINSITVPFQNDLPLPGFEKQDQTQLSLAGTWKKERLVMNQELTLQKRTAETIAALEQESKGRHLAAFDDSAWENKVIPGVENPAPDRYESGVWYRRNFEISKENEGKHLRLVFLAANYFTDVWVNGTWIGCHEGGYTPFVLDLTPYVKFGEKNSLAVRVDNIPWVPSGNRDQRNLTVPCYIGDWWNYGGIKRDVYIEICPAINIVRTDIRTKPVSPEKAQLSANVVIDNRSEIDVTLKVEVFIYKAKLTEKNIMAESAKDIIDLSRPLSVWGEQNTELTALGKDTVACTFTLSADWPELWTPAQPNLYVLQVKIYDLKNKQLVDKYYTQFGIREFTINKEKAAILLNGEPLKLNGLARHEVYPGSEEVPGKKSPQQIIYNDLMLIKEANCNFIRTAHYPNHPFTQVMADRLGLVVWEEIPVYWFGGPEFDIQRKERGIARQMWQEMIYQDYNRASVGIWGTCNECSWQTERALFVKELRDIAYQIDGTRFVAQSASGSDDKDPSQKDMDVLGFTMYYGVFYGKDYFEDTLAALETMHKTFPDKPIIATEFGVWAPYKEDTMQLKQVELFKETMNAFNKVPALAGTVWWTAFDWHTMINDPGTMGVMTMDRKLYKKVFSSLQKEYGQTTGNIQVVSPKQEEKLAGKVPVKAAFMVGKDWPTKEIVIDNEKKYAMKALGNSYYSYDLDTKLLGEGMHSLVFKAWSSSGTAVSEAFNVVVDNIDEPPLVQFGPKDGSYVMNNVILSVHAEDDRGIASVKYAIDAGPLVDMADKSKGNYQARWDASALNDGSVHGIKFRIEDTGKNVVENLTKVIIDNSPGLYVDLPFDTDMISTEASLADGTGWDFPAEELPDSNRDFIFMGKEKIKYKFGPKEDGQNNNVECIGQVLKVPNGRYTKVHILATMHNGSSKVDFTLCYTDGTTEVKKTAFSDWWGGKPVFDDEPAVVTSYHHEKEGIRQPGVAIFSQTIIIDPKKIMNGLGTPNDPRVHIFAISLEGEKIDFNVPEIAFQSPAGNIYGGKETLDFVIKGETITKAEYALNANTWIRLKPYGNDAYIGTLDTTTLKDGPYTLSVRAFDKYDQIGTAEKKINVFNRVNIVGPIPNAPVYKSCKIMAIPKAHSQVDKMLYKIDKMKEAPLTATDKGFYEAVWLVSEKFKPGSEHTITVIQVDKKGKKESCSIPVAIGTPLHGHNIKVNKDVRDWVGTAPAENSWAISADEFIWTDAKGDDNGSGTYTYPTSKVFTKSSDLREFRVTYDDHNLYFLIKCSRPGDWWAPFRLIGIDTNGVEGGLEKQGEVTLPGLGEVNVAPGLACEYAVGISSTYKGFVWDGEGKVIARKEGKDSDTAGFLIDDYNWNNVEVAIPWQMLGGQPPGKTWRFIVGIGQQDNDHFREVNEFASEWHGGGGEGNEGETGSDPDIYDLASPSSEIQQKELSSYKAAGPKNDAASYAIIERSFVPVTFE
ncbi:MAG: glucodextranase DOMON-like domain-containing protein [bacterium]|nr:glucodextranase DOMON-like domain-containing protein [bacterium]MDD5353591.1 glucodextranase DOMON-like domain-containing protein [bacterium]